jgi:hypothetical protein
MAITSLVLGCLSPFSCAVFGVGSLVGIVLGIAATVKAQRYPAEYGGKVMAIIGVGLNGFSLVFLLPIIAAMTIPNLVASRMAANEASARVTLRMIGSAEAQYQSTVTNGKQFANINQLIEVGFLAPGIATKNGYKFEIKPAENWTRSGTEYKFEAFATPASYNVTGRQSYYTCQDFVIRGADKSGKPAGITDDPIDPKGLPTSTRSLR